MQAPETIEAGLRRLMPPGLSEAGMSSIEAMLDELAGDQISETPERNETAKPRFWMSAGIAAAVAALIALNLPHDGVSANFTVLEPVDFEPLGLVLIGGTDQIEEMSDAGWVAAPDGRAMEATLVRMVEANSYRDEETGVVVEVSEPREEILLTPITAF